MIRIIPRLDIKGPNLVKGIHLEGLRVLGDPKDYANFYYQAGADELIFQDVVASLYQRNSLNDIIEKTARDIFIPLTVGGGLRSLNDIKDVLRAGADKVSINTAAIQNPEFIREASLEFGSSTICIALEVNKQSNGEYLCFTDNGREFTGLNALEWAEKVEALGAGELIITSIDKEGTKKGMDISLIKKIYQSVSIPIIAHGGLGNESHAIDAVKNGAHAICSASALHYNCINELKNFSELSGSEGNLEYILNQLNSKSKSSITIKGLKEYLNKEGEECRF